MVTETSYAVGKGTPILALVEEILLQRGYTRYVIDQSRADAVAPDNHTWQLAERATWLTVVNELLGMVGYAGVWSDWNGYLRCHPYQRPIERPAEWYLSADPATSILGDDAEIEFDFHAAYNKWVGVQSNNLDDATPPVEGAGIYTMTNDNDGPTSIQARRGLTLVRREDFEVTSQADLITQVQAMADADMSVPTTIAVSTAPLPLAWHFDRYQVDDPAIGAVSEVLGTSWRLPLTGERMTHTWSVLSGVQS